MTESNMIIEIPSFKEAWDRIKKIHHSYKRGRIKHLRILGVSGVAKTFLASSYEAAHPRTEQGTFTHIPVVHFKIPSSPSQKRVFQSLLKSLKGPNSGEIRGTAEKIRERIVTLVKSCGVELLIGDEIQHFLDRGKAHTYAAATDSLKELMEELQRPVILMGAPRAETLFLHNGQFRSRIMATHRMRPFHLDDLRVFRGFVGALAANLPEDARAWLSSEETGIRIFYATDGIHRTVTGFVLDVADHVSSGRPMNYDTLSNVFRENIWNEPSPKLDPFRHDFRMPRLNPVGTSFHPTALDGDNHAGSFL